MILGIDPGLEHTGWSLLNRDRYCLANGVVCSSRELADDQRIAEIVEGLRDVLLRFSPSGRSPSIASVEQYGYQGEHSKTCNAFRLPLLVGEIQGFLRCQGLVVSGPTRGQALQSMGLPPNAKDSSARLTIRRLVQSKGGTLPTNEHTRAAYAAAWWAVSATDWVAIRCGNLKKEGESNG